MRSLLLGAVLVLAGCPKNDAGGTTTTGGGSGTGTDQPIKATVVSFGTQNLAGIEADTPKTKVWMSVTDETGSAKSFPIDEIAAECSAEVGGELGAVGTLRCWWAGAGANYIAVARAQDLIILRQWTEEGTDEPADYEELTRISLSLGARVTFELD